MGVTRSAGRSIAISLGRDQQRPCSGSHSMFDECGRSEAWHGCGRVMVGDEKKNLQVSSCRPLGYHVRGKHSMARTLDRLPARGKRRWFVIQRALARGNETQAGRMPLLDAARLERRPPLDPVSQAVRVWARAVRECKRIIIAQAPRLQRGLVRRGPRACSRRQSAAAARRGACACHRAHQRPRVRGP